VADPMFFTVKNRDSMLYLVMMGEARRINDDGE
jgi:hypothetical protein